MMHAAKMRLTPALIIGVVLAGVPRWSGRADDAPATGLSKAEFIRLREELNLKNQPWSTIGWKVSLTEARQLAARQRKPIFLVVNTGNCLGWT
jgi:hypothetical protein